jgi:VWFA-related protein
MSLNDNHIQMRRFCRKLVPLSAAVALSSGLLLAQFDPPQSTVPHSEVQQDQDQTPTIKVDVNLVNILYSVKAKKGGALIPNLEKSDFTIFEDGKEQKIQQFSRETDLPITLGLLIDVSLSQERLVDIERQAASAFFDAVIRRKDEAFVISFGKDVQLLQDMTGSARQLTASMNDLQPDAEPPRMGNIPVNNGPIPQTGTPKGTLLYDAVVLASNDKLSGEVGRKALILITDGDDEGSTYDRRAAIEAAQKANSIIFSIYYVDRGFYSRYGMSFGGGGEGELRKMSDETGGQVFTVSGKHPLSEVFKEIQDELRNQYSIAYSPDNPARDGTFRHIEIKLDKPDDRVQARNGYFATANGGQ